VKRWIRCLAAVLCLKWIVFGTAFADAENKGSLSLLAINVRKADCLLLRSGNSAYLVDTGTKDSVDRVLAVLEEEGIRHLDGIILTHTHADHTGGLKQLLASDLEIDTLYAPKWSDKEEGKHPIDKALKKNPQRDGIGIVRLSSGDSLPLDGGSLEVLGPLEESDVENCNSLVLLASAGGGTMLLTGDMEIPEENSLLSARLIPKVDVIKIGNHGEGDATGPALIRACEPKAAVISTNTEDEKDTPDKRVIRLLQQWNVAVYQTQDTENGVLVTIENGEISVTDK
jgi:competence protein ComEC